MKEDHKHSRKESGADCRFRGSEEKSTDAKTLFHRKKWIIPLVCGIIIGIFAVCAILANSNLVFTKKKAQQLMNDAVSQTLQMMDEANILQDTLGQNLMITVLKLERTSGVYQGVCLVRSVNCADVLIDYLSKISIDEVASGSEILNRLEAVVETAPVVQQEFVVEFARTDDGYVPIFSEEMVNFCSGNMYSVQEYLIERLEQEGVK